MHWLQSIADVRQRPTNDDAHSVIEIRSAHLLLEIGRDGFLSDVVHVLERDGFMAPHTQPQNALNASELFEEKLDKIRARKCGLSALYFTTRSAPKAFPKRQFLRKNERFFYEKFATPSGITRFSYRPARWRFGKLPR